MQNFADKPVFYTKNSCNFKGFLAEVVKLAIQNYLLPETVVVVFASLSPTTVPSVTKLDACEDLTTCTASGTPLITQGWFVKGGLGGGQEHKAGQDTQQQ